MHFFVFYKNQYIEQTLIMITVKQIKNGNTKKAQQTLLITSKCVVLARVINIIFFMLKLALFSNYS